MKLVPAQCCNCGANVEVHKEQDAAICTACGTPFIVEKAINLYVTNQVSGSNDFEIVGGVLKRYRGAGVDIIIPDSVYEFEVDKLGYTAVFEECKYLRSVKLPMNLKMLPGNSFRELRYLESIEFDENLEVIEGSAFRNCTSLKNIVLPQNLQEIYWGAFGGCSSLVEIEFPESIKSISGFDNCTGLEKVILPRNVKGIGKFAFCDCSSLVSIVWPKNLKKIGKGAFENCSKLAEVTIPDSVEIIDDEAFCGCSSLVSIVLPKNLKRIGKGAFENCSKLAEVTIPDSVEIIDEEAFRGCCSLKSVVFPKNLKVIGIALFKDCQSLGNSVSFPENLERIERFAFDHCSSLVDIELPNQLKKVDALAFHNCKSLRMVNIPGNTDLDVTAFYSSDNVVLVSNYIDQITRFWIELLRNKVIFRNRMYKTFDFFNPAFSERTKETISKNGSMTLIFVNSAFMKDYHEYPFNYGDVEVYDFLFMDDFNYNFVGYGKNGGYENLSNYNGFCNNRAEADKVYSKIQKICKDAGIVNYTLEYYAAPNVVWEGGLLFGRLFPHGSKLFLKFEIPLHP